MLESTTSLRCRCDLCTGNLHRRTARDFPLGFAASLPTGTDPDPFRIVTIDCSQTNPQDNYYPDPRTLR